MSCESGLFIFFIRIRLVVSVKTLIDIRGNTQFSFVDLIGIADDIKTPVDDLNTVQEDIGDLFRHVVKLTAHII